MLVTPLVSCDALTTNDIEARSAEFGSEGVVVYERVKLVEADGVVLSDEEHGTWTFDLAERVARPWLHVDDGIVHDELAWHVVHPDGSVETGYRITEVTVQPVDPPFDPLDPPPQVDSSWLEETAASLAEDADIAVLVRLAAWSPDPLPWVPDPTTVSAADYDGFLAEKKGAAAARDAAFEEASQALVSAIEVAGGVVEARLSGVGTLSGHVPAGALAALAARPDVRAIVPDAQGDVGVLGDPVPLGDLRVFTGAQDYIDAGYSGTFCNPWCPIPGFIIGVMEPAGFTEGACFQGWNGCSPQRQRKLFECTASVCNPVASFQQITHHGAIVASAAMGDYSNGQADGLEQTIAPGLTDWEEDASGFAPHAGLDYYSEWGLDSRRVRAYECAHGVGHQQCMPVAVTNQSSGTSPINPVGNACNAASWLPVEGALEDAADAGALPVVITHNGNNYPFDDECRVRSPADIPKALAVGALVPLESTPYHSWPYAKYSNRGGGTSNYWIYTGMWWLKIPVDGAMSMVDLVASGRPGSVTLSAGWYGEVSPQGPSAVENGLLVLGEGTSFAAPQVAGAATLLRSRHADAGHFWIGNPGRLHAVMLAMGDRATLGNDGATDPSCISGNRIRCGADRYYGLGRLTLRVHPSFLMRTRTFTSSTSHTISEIVLSPLGSQRKLVKCVMQQREDMVSPDKDFISVIGLQLQIRGPNPQTGTCQANEGTVYHTVTDNRVDDKHMVAVTDAEVALAGRCVQVNYTKISLYPGQSIMTNTYCVADDELDYD